MPVTGKTPHINRILKAWNDWEQCEMPNEWSKASAPVSITQLTSQESSNSWSESLSFHGCASPSMGFGQRKTLPMLLAGAAVTSSNCLTNCSWNFHRLYPINSSSEEFLQQDLLFPLPSHCLPPEHEAKHSQIWREKKWLAHADNSLEYKIVFWIKF